MSACHRLDREKEHRRWEILYALCVHCRNGLYEWCQVRRRKFVYLFGPSVLRLFGVRSSSEHYTTSLLLRQTAAAGWLAGWRTDHVEIVAQNPSGVFLCMNRKRASKRTGNNYMMTDWAVNGSVYSYRLGKLNWRNSKQSDTRWKVAFGKKRKANIDVFTFHSYSPVTIVFAKWQFITGECTVVWDDYRSERGQWRWP